MSSADLNAMIARIRSLGPLASEVAAEAAPAIERLVVAAAAAGTNIDGKAWTPKKDGSRALPNVANDLSVVATGTVIQIRLTGNEVFWQHAKGKKGRARREVLPDGGAGVPPAMADIVARTAARVFARKTGG